MIYTWESKIHCVINVFIHQVFDEYIQYLHSIAWHIWTPRQLHKTVHESLTPQRSYSTFFIRIENTIDNYNIYITFV